jgi:hypothetical protein
MQSKATAMVRGHCRCVGEELACHRVARGWRARGQLPSVAAARAVTTKSRILSSPERSSFVTCSLRASGHPGALISMVSSASWRRCRLAHSRDANLRHASTLTATVTTLAPVLIPSTTSLMASTTTGPRDRAGLEATPSSVRAMARSRGMAIRTSVTSIELSFQQDQAVLWINFEREVRFRNRPYGPNPFSSCPKSVWDLTVSRLYLRRARRRWSAVQHCITRLALARYRATGIPRSAMTRRVGSSSTRPIWQLIGYLPAQRSGRVASREHEPTRTLPLSISRHIADPPGQSRHCRGSLMRIAVSQLQPRPALLIRLHDIVDLRENADRRDHLTW